MIQILKGYRGRLTGEQFIPPGVYREDDDALFGLADYLVANRHAVVVEETNLKSFNTPPEATSDLVLSESSLEELKALGYEMGLDLGEAQDKTELIALIKAAASDEQPPAETKPGIEDLTLAELKEEATQRGLQFNSRITKAELIALIEGSAKEATDDQAT